MAFTDRLPHRVSTQTEGRLLSDPKAEGEGVPEQGRLTPSPVCVSDSVLQIGGGKWDALEQKQGECEKTSG